MTRKRNNRNNGKEHPEANGKSKSDVQELRKMWQGLPRNNGKILDNQVKGKAILKYRVYTKQRRELMTQSKFVKFFGKKKAEELIDDYYNPW